MTLCSVLLLLLSAALIAVSGWFLNVGYTLSKDTKYKAKSTQMITGGWIFTSIGAFVFLIALWQLLPHDLKDRLMFKSHPSFASMRYF